MHNIRFQKGPGPQPNAKEVYNATLGKNEEVKTGKMLLRWEQILKGLDVPEGEEYITAQKLLDLLQGCQYADSGSEATRLLTEGIHKTAELKKQLGDFENKITKEQQTSAGKIKENLQ